VRSDQPVQALADASMLRQVLVNLLANACEAIIEGTGIVSVRIEPPEADAVAVCIEDTGRGITPDDLPHIFEPFFSRKSDGTGLGLCATKKILDLMEAGIEVESRPGEGTMVTVRLQLAPPEEEEA
jgi:signal transduction histidine kinase